MRKKNYEVNCNMFKYVAKNPHTSEVRIKLFSTSREANKHGLSLLHEYPEFKVIYIPPVPAQLPQVKKELKHQ